MGLPRHESKHRIQAERAVLKTATQSVWSRYDGPLAVTKAATFPLGRDLHGAWTSGGSEHQRVAATGLVDEVYAEGGRTPHVKQAQPKRRLLGAIVHTAANLAHKVADLLTPTPLKQGYGKG